MEMPAYLEDEAALAEFLAAFEEPRLPKGAWTHAAHVAMAAVYLRRYGADVLEPTRRRIRAFNASVGGPPTAYHETLTVLWLGLVDEALKEARWETDLEAARHVVGLYGEDSKAHGRHYSFDVVASEEARRRWVAPDVREVKISFLLPSY